MENWPCLNFWMNLNINLSELQKNDEAATTLDSLELSNCVWLKFDISMLQNHPGQVRSFVKDVSNLVILSFVWVGSRYLGQDTGSILSTIMESSFLPNFESLLDWPECQSSFEELNGRFTTALLLLSSTSQG